jgi:hypothetical protein
MLIDDAYARFRDLDDRYGEAYALSQHGHALRWVGQYEEADGYLHGLRRFVGTCATGGHCLALAGRALKRSVRWRGGPGSDAWA